jgi:hypothetical protein
MLPGRHPSSVGDLLLVGNALSEAVTFRSSRSLIRVARQAGLFALGLCLVGCQPDEPDDPLKPPVVLEVGTGQTFTALAEGGTLDLYRGCQGSQHVYVSLRARELTTLKTQVQLSLERADDATKVSADFKLRLDFEPAPNVGEPAQLQGLLLPIIAPDRAVGQEVRLKASILSESNESATDTRTVTLQWGPPAC